MYDSGGQERKNEPMVYAHRRKEKKIGKRNEENEKMFWREWVDWKIQRRERRTENCLRVLMFVCFYLGKKWSDKITDVQNIMKEKKVTAHVVQALDAVACMLWNTALC